MERAGREKISVVIPNWNGRKWLGECLESLRRQRAAADEVMVVDDGSTDDSAAYVRENYPEVVLVELGENRGFCRAINEGIRRAAGEALLLLNNDTQPEAGCIEVLKRALEEYPRTGFFALQIVRAGEDMVESAGAAIRRNGRYYQRGLGSEYVRPDEDAGKPVATAAEPVFGNSAGAGLYRRRVFEDVGKFDEDFLMYHEDQDFNFRAQLRGHKCLYLPEAVVYHLGSATVGASSPRQVELLARNQLISVGKCMPTGLMPGVLWRLWWAETKSALFYARHRQLGAYLRGVWGAAVQLGRTMRKRRKIQAGRVVSNEEVAKLMGG